MNLIAIPDLANYLPSYFGSSYMIKTYTKKGEHFTNTLIRSQD